MITRRLTRPAGLIATFLCLLFPANSSRGAFNWCNQKMDATIEPRVLQIGQTGTVRFTVWTNPDPTRMEVSLRTGGPAIPVVHQPSGTWTFEVPVAKALEGYQVGLAHNYFGTLYQWDGDTQISVLTNLIVNVRDETMPTVPIRDVSNPRGPAQMTRHVLNIQDDTTYFWGTSPTGPPVDFFKRFYSYRPDDFDFLAIVGEGMAFENRYYVGLRNQTQGLGAAITDNGSFYGSPNKLQGYVNFPNDNMFDLAETGLSHELGHRWCCFVSLPTLADAHAPHWPMGDLAYGMMGITDPISKQGLQFPYILISQADGSYQARYQPTATEFTDLELYLMGLVPASQVAEHFVFNDQTQTAGGIMHGPVTRFTANDIIARNGQRSPAYGNAQTQFRLGTIVLSRNRLLEAHEMAHFEYMAARGESTWELDSSFGVLVSRVKPFYLSTRTKGTLSTTVCPECAGATSAVSSASFVRGGNLAPESIASTFGFGLTDSVQSASAQPLPTVLDATVVRVTDSGRAPRSSPLFFISHGQINFLVPEGTAPGTATVDVIHNGQTTATGQVNIAQVAPALFTANSDGQGVPAGSVTRAVYPTQGGGDPVVTNENLSQCGTTYGSCTPKPIDLGAENVQVFLVLYGTGIRKRTSLSGVTCTIGGVPADVQYAGLNQYFAGLDQVNVLIPRGLKGRGQVDLVLTVDGKPANAVKVNIK